MLASSVHFFSGPIGAKLCRPLQCLSPTLIMGFLNHPRRRPPACTPP